MFDTKPGAAAMLAIFIAMTSCSDGGGGSGDVSAACDRYAQTYCDAAETCDLGTASFIDPATCADRFATLCENAFALDGTAVTAEDLDVCAATIEDALCGGNFGALFDVCYPLLAGTRPDGAPCATLTQCAGGWCDVTDESGCGVCGSLPVAGEPCPDGLCALSAVCSEGTCVAITFAEDGEPCDPPAIQCNFRSSCAGGVCVALAAEGEPCEPGRCRSGLECDATSNVCIVEPPPAAEGEPCGFDMDTGDFVFCDASTYCADDVCVARVPDGGSCTDTTSCMFGAQCVGGTCQVEFPMCE